MRARFVNPHNRERCMIRTNTIKTFQQLKPQLKAIGMREVGLIGFWKHVLFGRIPKKSSWVWLDSHLIDYLLTSLSGNTNFCRIRFNRKSYTGQTMRITNNKQKIISFPEYIQDNTHFHKGTRGNFFFFGVTCNYGDGEQSTEFVIDQDSTLYQRFIDTLASIGDVQEAVIKDPQIR